jgi:pyruvate/2-oxoglutarate dehydrogenase complex dihydrolipoamide dehydrogenase (E3) component
LIWKASEYLNFTYLKENSNRIINSNCESL